MHLNRAVTQVIKKADIEDDERYSIKGRDHHDRQLCKEELNQIHYTEHAEEARLLSAVKEGKAKGKSITQIKR